MEKGYYFDYAATTFPKYESVYRTMDEANRLYAVNAGRSTYALARKASNLIEDTRKMILELAHTDSHVAEVILTASATIACNQIFGGLQWKEQDIVYVSPFEHNAVMRSLFFYGQCYGFMVEQLALDEKTLQLDLEKIKFQFLRKKPNYVIMTHVSNVTGYILPIEEVGKMAKEYSAAVIVDGAQAFGTVPVFFQDAPIDFYIFAGHKTLYGPFGTGGFIHRKTCELNTFLAGGTGSDSLNLCMPKTGVAAYEPGSHNIVAIAGLYAALQEHFKQIKQSKNEAFFLTEEQKQGNYLIAQLKKIPKMILYVPTDLNSHTAIVSFNLQGYQAFDVGMILDEDYHIAVRTGYQCAPLIHSYLADEAYLGVVRASIGRFTKKEEIDYLIKAVKEIVEEN